MRLSLYSLLAATCLNACSMVPDYAKPNLDFSDAWEQTAGQTDRAPIAWWESFGDVQLNNLTSQALTQNNDLVAAIARVEQARAGQDIAGAPLLPSASATGSTSQQLNEGRNAQSQASINLSYELDLFGKNRARYQSAIAAWEASGYNRDALAIVVAGDVSSNYIGWLLTQERLRIARENEQNVQNVLNIVQARFDAGRSSALEVSQQRQQLANAQASIAALTSTADSYRYRLAVLLGQAPQSFALQPASFDALTLPQVTPTLPSELITQRPDIQAAEATLRAANADIGAARAAFFPTPSIGLQWLIPEASSSLFTLTGSVLQTIFSGGALTGELDRNKARYEELAAVYRDSVLTAFEEVSNALSQQNTTAIRNTALTEGLTAARDAYRIATASYNAGSTDFTTLLDTQRSLFSAEDSAANTRFEQFQAGINLYKALGGTAALSVPATGD